MLINGWAPDTHGPWKGPNDLFYRVVDGKVQCEKGDGGWDKSDSYCYNYPPSVREFVNSHMLDQDLKDPLDQVWALLWFASFTTQTKEWHESFVTECALQNNLEMAWVLLANVSGGDWTVQSKEWQVAAAKWRDEHLHYPKLTEKLINGWYPGTHGPWECDANITGVLGTYQVKDGIVQFQTHSLEWDKSMEYSSNEKLGKWIDSHKPGDWPEGTHGPWTCPIRDTFYYNYEFRVVNGGPEVFDQKEWLPFSMPIHKYSELVEWINSHKPQSFQMPPKSSANPCSEIPLSDDPKYGYTTKAKRFNKGKALLDYLLDLPMSLTGICRVFEFGAGKYGKDNWKKPGNSDDEYLASCLRHLMAFKSGEIFDQETGCNHLIHSAWNLLVLAEKNYPDRIISKEFFNILERQTKNDS